MTPDAEIRNDEQSTKNSSYIDMRRCWWDRIVIIKEGSIQGWFVSFIFTILTMTMLALGFFMDNIANGWIKYGGTYATIYLGSTGIWLGYKIAKKRVENGNFQLSEIIETVTKTMKSKEKPLDQQ